MAKGEDDQLSGAVSHWAGMIARATGLNVAIVLMRGRQATDDIAQMSARTGFAVRDEAFIFGAGNALLSAAITYFDRPDLDEEGRQRLALLRAAFAPLDAEESMCAVQLEGVH